MCGSPYTDARRCLAQGQERGDGRVSLCCSGSSSGAGGLGAWKERLLRNKEVLRDSNLPFGLRELGFRRLNI